MSTSGNYPRSVQVSVHLDAIAHNYQVLRARARSKAFAVLKADAYGHGADAVASYLSNLADGFAVATVGEAIAVRDAGIVQPILVMQGPQDDEDIDAIYQYGLWPALHDELQIEFVQKHRNAIDIAVWLKVDTGMGRLGVSLQSAETHLKNDRLRWQGVMSHLSSADDLNNTFTEEQAVRLSELVNRYQIDSSLANTAGVLGWPNTQRNWARLGIGLYGVHPVLDHQDSDSLLQAAMSVTAPIVSVKQLPAGHSVGYCQTYRCPADMLVAHVAIGYGDGFPRAINGAATVIVRGVACPIIGRVSMDSIAVDCRPLGPMSALSTSSWPKLGEPVTVWGSSHWVSETAAAAGTISYDLLTRIRGRRTYTD